MIAKSGKAFVWPYVASCKFNGKTFHQFRCAHFYGRENATEAQRESHDRDIVDVVRSALIDDESNVRAAAAKAFDSLQEHLGAKAIDQTIPTLLEALRQPGASSETALQALKEVMNVSYVIYH
jgi:hypothetical protein